MNQPAAHRPRFNRVVLAVAASSLLAGCAGIGSQSTPARSGSLAPQSATRISNTLGSDSVLRKQQHIFVTTIHNNTLYEFSLTGTLIRTITMGLNSPHGVAVDSAGKIYVANYLNNTITTYTETGRPTTPTITTGLSSPAGVAVDAAGKIYVTNEGNGTLTTYMPNGTQTTPTINGLSSPGFPAVDAAGKIYVPNQSTNTLTTYRANGGPTTPTITTKLNVPGDVKIGATGKIWIANEGNPGNSSITSYTAQGTRTSPTITAGISQAEGIALTTNAIYVTNQLGNNVTVYNLQGAQTATPISGLTQGLSGIAVH